jgi:hypothetical protein
VLSEPADNNQLSLRLRSPQVDMFDSILNRLEIETEEEIAEKNTNKN